MGKKRAICWKCGAKKYLKYLTQVVWIGLKIFNKDGSLRKGEPMRYQCINEKKCKKRSANYKK